ncbi:MAG: DNA methyltransferase, partial [Spirochaetota bacterium]|nr:DNA methyltransferase [Spirochaetota bacterium]
MSDRFDFGGNKQKDNPVECLGRTFESEDARREYFSERLREKLKDPEFRKIDGFPLGDDEDILALSDPPYYTACPNPFLEEFIEQEGKPYDPNEKYHREPFAADVSEGKNDPIYNAHSYHTKVPHKAIMRYILHYTEPGDLVFDGFAGTGMTGVAAQLCGDERAVEDLGYRVQQDGVIRRENGGEPFSKLGARKAILNDLSPAATFIAYNYNTPVDTDAFAREAERILDEVEAECGWMYWTLHNPTEAQIREAVALLKVADFKTRLMDSDLPLATINYTVWSDVFVCPECMNEIVFWE